MVLFIIFCPIVAAILIIAGLPARKTALAAAVLTLATTVSLLGTFLVGQRDFQHITSFTISPEWHLSFTTGLDGLSFVMVLLAAIVTLAAVWFTGQINKYENAFYACLLLISGGAIGAFASIDLFFFYAFHELALIPTFLLIGIWGSENRFAAAWKITIYLAIGSFILLLGLILLYQSVPVASRSFDIRALQAAAAAGQISAEAQRHVYLLLIIGFGILVSLFPFHTWAPEAYAAAPAPAAMLHAGVLKKFGLYGLLRLAIPLLPEGARYWTSLLLVLLLSSIIYVGLVTIAQKRLDWMLGYSSVMHMGYIFLGIASASILGATGAIVLMFAHGLSIALLFAIAGEVRKRTGTLLFSELGGLGKLMPFASLAFVRGDWSSWLCQLCRRNHDLFWRVQERLGNGTLPYFSNRDSARTLGRRHFNGLYAARLSQSVHGHHERAVAGSRRSSLWAARSGYVAGWRAYLLRILPAVVCANRNSCVSHLFDGEQKLSNRCADL